MKIATTTFHCAYNYGAVLQAYSLVKSLRNSGYDASVIDYWPKHRREEELSPWIKKKPFSTVTMMQNAVIAFRYSALTARRKKFDHFRENILPRTEQRYDSAETLLKNPPQAEAYITGSDQVWNPATGVDPVYFLEFAKELGKKSVAYAPSIGLPSIPEKFQPSMRKLISQVDHLSSREHRGCEIIKELTTRTAEVVVDPVFLQTKEEWSSLVQAPTIKGDYILVYAVRRREHMEKEVLKLKKKLGLPVVMIVGTNPCSRGLMPADHVVWDAGPVDFVNLFAHATCVCTNSFHGTAFSIIFQKPFFNFPHTNGDSRASSILDRTNQKDRLIYPGMQTPDIFNSSKIDQEKLQQEIQKSKKYLHDSIMA